MDIRKKYFDMGKDEGVKWARNNQDNIKEALAWRPTPGGSDPRENPNKSAAGHFINVMHNNPELNMIDYENRMSEALEYYYQGWTEGLEEVLSIVLTIES